MNVHSSGCAGGSRHGREMGGQRTEKLTREEQSPAESSGSSSPADFALDKEGTVAVWSAAAEALYGWGEKKILGRDFSVLFADEERQKGVPAALLQAAREEGSTKLTSPLHIPNRQGDTCRMIITALNGVEQTAIGYSVLVLEREQPMKSSEPHATAFTHSRALLERERRLRQECELARAALTEQLIQIQERERKRIARELHDECGQHLATLDLELAMLAGAYQSEPKLQRHVAQLKRIVQKLSDGIQRISFELHPLVLQEGDLCTALNEYLEQWVAKSGLKTDFHCSGFERIRLPAHCETAMYRIAQEALTNVLKHSRATAVSVVLKKDDEGVQLIVEDDGRGFNPETFSQRGKAERGGIFGMKERAALLGGSCTLESSPKGRTTVFVRIPAASLEALGCDEA